jgi:hypothetical protein
MQSNRKQDSIIIDFKKIKELMLLGIKFYIRDVNVDFFKFFKNSGMNRALQLKEYLTQIPSDNKHAILALLLALFDKHRFWGRKIGSSNLLALKIADYFIGRVTGDLYGIELDSPVFNQSSLKQVANMDGIAIAENQDLGRGYYYIKKVLAVSHLLQLTLASTEFKYYKYRIEDLAKKLESTLTEGATTKINLKIFEDLRDDPFDIFQVDVITEAAFSLKIPSDAAMHIGSFLTKKDCPRLLRANKAAAMAAKIGIEEFKSSMKYKEP